MNDILKEIEAEIKRQNSIWGEQNHKPIEWIAILTEEVGEASREVVDHHFKNHVKDEQGRFLFCDAADQRTRLERYRKEMLEVAAVAIQMIDCLDRNGFIE